MTNESEVSCARQLDSTGVNDIAVKLLPPSTDRRATQPPPAKTVSASSACTSVRFCSVPTGSPLQLVPPSVVFSSVPTSPAA